MHTNITLFIKYPPNITKNILSHLTFKVNDSANFTQFNHNILCTFFYKKTPLNYILNLVLLNNFSIYANIKLNKEGEIL